MRIAVTGSRQYCYVKHVEAVLYGLLAKCPRGMTLIHGGCSGVDAIANAWAWGERAHGAKIEILSFPPDWRTHGRDRAEFARNFQMLDAKPDLIVSFPGAGASIHLINLAEKAGVAIHRPPVSRAGA